jgi:predicted transposase/invertase (TIGR01784 family)
MLTTDLDKWLYFLRHAEKMDPEALPAALRDPIFVRAFEELKMLSQTDVEREQYEARRKWQLDYNTGMMEARLEGEEKGRKEGAEGGRREERMRLIQFCQRLLRLPVTSAEDLAHLAWEELGKLADRLQGELLQARQSD